MAGQGEEDAGWAGQKVVGSGLRDALLHLCAVHSTKGPPVTDVAASEHVCIARNASWGGGGKLRFRGRCGRQRRGRHGANLHNTKMIKLLGRGEHRLRATACAENGVDNICWYVDEYRSSGGSVGRTAWGVLRTVGEGRCGVWLDLPASKRRPH